MSAKAKIVFLVLFLFAFAIRVSGITYGLPFSQSEKEQRSVNTALKMAATKDLNPYQVGKGLIWYILLVEFGLYYLIGRATGRFSSPFDFAKDFFLDHTELYLIDRLNQIALALLSLWFLFRLCKRLLGDDAGIWALAFGAYSAVHVDISRHASEDMLIVLFGILTLERILIYQGTGKLRDLAWAGLFSALTTSAKITGGITLMAALTALIYRKEWKRTLFAILLFAAFYALLNPYLFISFKSSLEALSRDAALRQSVTERQSIVTTLHIVASQMLGYPLAALVLLGLFAPYPLRKTIWLTAASPVILFMATLGHGWGIGPLYAMAMWPMLMVIATAGFAFLYQRVHRGAAWGVGILSLLLPLFYLPGYPAVAEQIRIYSQHAPAHEMIIWIRKNLPRGESIAAMSGDVWKGRLFLTPERIRERMDRFDEKEKFHMGLEYNLGNLQMYEFMLKVVESDSTAPCFQMRYLDGHTSEEMKTHPRRQTIYWIEDIQPYEQWKNISALMENYFLFVAGMDLPTPRETEIKTELDRVGSIVVAFPPFYLYSLKQNSTSHMD